jgi:hypothetical protein
MEQTGRSLTNLIIILLLTLVLLGTLAFGLDMGADMIRWGSS